MLETGFYPKPEAARHKDFRGQPRYPEGPGTRRRKAHTVRSLKPPATQSAWSLFLWYTAHE